MVTWATRIATARGFIGSLAFPKPWCAQGARGDGRMAGAVAARLSRCYRFDQLPAHDAAPWPLDPAAFGQRRFAARGPQSGWQTLVRRQPGPTAASLAGIPARRRLHLHLAWPGQA